MQTNQAMGKAMMGASKAMASGNKSMNLQQMKSVTMQFQKESAKMTMAEEMMSETLDDAFSEDEEEQEEIMDQIYDEIGLDIQGMLSQTPARNLPQKQKAEMDVQSDLERRLAEL